MSDNISQQEQQHQEALNTHETEQKHHKATELKGVAKGYTGAVMEAVGKVLNSAASKLMHSGEEQKQTGHYEKEQAAEKQEELQEKIEEEKHRLDEVNNARQVNFQEDHDLKAPLPNIAALSLQEPKDEQFQGVEQQSVEGSSSFPTGYHGESLGDKHNHVAAAIIHDEGLPPLTGRNAYPPNEDITGFESKIDTPLNSAVPPTPNPSLATNGVADVVPANLLKSDQSEPTLTGRNEYSPPNSMTGLAQDQHQQNDSQVASIIPDSLLNDDNSEPKLTARNEPDSGIGSSNDLASIDKGEVAAVLEEKLPQTAGRNLYIPCEGMEDTEMSKDAMDKQVGAGTGDRVSEGVVQGNEQARDEYDFQKNVVGNKMDTGNIDKSQLPTLDEQRYDPLATHRDTGAGWDHSKSSEITSEDLVQAPQSIPADQPYK